MTKYNIIESVFRKQLIPGVVGITDLAGSRDLNGLSEHILKMHSQASFNDQMYRHLAAVGRGELTIQPAKGATVEFTVADHVREFIHYATDSK